MSENEAKELIDRIINGEYPDISELTEEQKEFLKAFIDNFMKVVKLAEVIVDTLK